MLKRIRNFLVGGIGALAIRAIAPTLRIRVQDESGLLNQTPSTPVIFAFWHNRMFLMPYFYRRFLPGRRAVCLISTSQDGEMIARVLSHFNLGAVRGSSSRGGREAFRGLVENLKRGWDVAITPDGPRGPRYQAHIGVIGLASLSGQPLIPVNYQLEWKLELSSWDRFMIPLPFSRCHLRLGKPMTFPSSMKDDVLESGRSELERHLDR